MKEGYDLNNVNECGSEKCTGCSVCAVVCPKNIISINLSNDGFWNPEIDESECSECGLCKRVCYKYDDEIIQTGDPIKSLAAVNENKEVLNKSSSGGISDALANSLIDKVYKVIGVTYDYDMDIAKSVIIDKKEDLVKIRGSKYFQSFTFDAFNDALKDKSDTKYVVFGTPCHIYAIHKYLDMKGNLDKFVFVDLYCHGTPSLHLWGKYNKSIKSKMKVKRFSEIEFRSKAKGWHRYCFKFMTEDGRQWVSPIAGDKFHSLFFSDAIFNPPCNDCKLRSTGGYTDIRLGDFWGRQYDANREGVSFVSIYTKTGLQVFEETNNIFLLKEVVFSDAIKKQSYGKEHKVNIDSRNMLLDSLRDDASINDTVSKYKSTLSFKESFKITIIDLFKRMPYGLTVFLRKMYHK